MGQNLLFNSIAYLPIHNYADALGEEIYMTPLYHRPGGTPHPMEKWVQKSSPVENLT